MPKQSCFSMRPGTIFGYRGEAWKVISNDTLIRRFTACKIGTSLTKSWKYSPGQEITIRWAP